jgi:hypothetical protein
MDPVWSWGHNRAQGAGIPEKCGSVQRWIPLRPEVWGSWQGVDPVQSWHPIGILVGHGSGAELGAGVTRGVESQAERRSSSAGLWGRDLVGWLFF